MNNKGVTLIELLVVAAVMVIISTMVFSNYGSGENRMSLERASKKLVQDIIRAQEMSTSTLDESGICTSGTGLTGYGIYFDELNSEQYIIYRNCNAAKSYDGGVQDEVKETINIEEGIQIYNILKNGADDPDNKVSILFEPPDPTTFLDGADSGTASVVIYITSDTGEQKTVTVNSGGMVTLE